MSGHSPTSHSFYSQRLRLQFVEWGNVHAPTIVFVHGVRDHSRTWDDLLEHFADDYHIVAPDLRGMETLSGLRDRVTIIWTTCTICTN